MLETVDDEMERFEDKYDECFFADCEKCETCTFFDEDDSCDCDCDCCDEEYSDTEKYDEFICLSSYGGKYYMDGVEIDKQKYDNLCIKYFAEDWN